MMIHKQYLREITNDKILVHLRDTRRRYQSYSEYYMTISLSVVRKITSLKVFWEITNAEKNF